MSAPFSMHESKKAPKRSGSAGEAMNVDPPQAHMEPMSPVPVAGLTGAGQPGPQSEALTPTVTFKKPSHRPKQIRSRTKTNLTDEEPEAEFEQRLAALHHKEKKHTPSLQPTPSFLEAVLFSNFGPYEEFFGAVLTTQCFRDFEVNVEPGTVLLNLFYPNSTPRNPAQIRPLINLVGALRALGVSWANLGQLMETDRLIDYIGGEQDLVRSLAIYGCPALAHYLRADIMALDFGATKTGEAYFKQNRMNPDGSLSGCHLLKHWDGQVASLRNVSQLNFGMINGKHVWLYQYADQRGAPKLKTVCQDIDAGNQILWEARRLGVLTRVYNRAAEWTVTVRIAGQNGNLNVNVTFKGSDLVHIT